MFSDEGRVKEIVLQLKGVFPNSLSSDFNLFEEEAFKSYEIIKKFLEGYEGLKFRNRYNLSNDDFEKFVLQLYISLLKNHSFFGNFKKKLLIILEYFKYYLRKLGL